MKHLLFILFTFLIFQTSCKEANLDQLPDIIETVDSLLQENEIDTSEVILDSINIIDEGIGVINDLFKSENNSDNTNYTFVKYSGKNTIEKDSEGNFWINRILLIDKNLI